jgi:hypothetical protein
MRMTEKEINEIKSNYDGGHSPELLNHLKRHFRTFELNYDWMTSPVKMIVINEKGYSLYENKKFLTSKISNIVEDEWIHLGIPKIRKTVKYFLDGIK